MVCFRNMSMSMFSASSSCSCLPMFPNCLCLASVTLSPLIISPLKIPPKILPHKRFQSGGGILNANVLRPRHNATNSQDSASPRQEIPSGFNIVMFVEHKISSEASWSLLLFLRSQKTKWIEVGRQQTRQKILAEWIKEKKPLTSSVSSASRGVSKSPVSRCSLVSSLRRAAKKRKEKKKKAACE